MMQAQSGTQLLLRQFLELCSSRSIFPTPTQLEEVAQKIKRYEACCRCYGWESNLPELLLFYRQINTGIRSGIVDEPTAILHKTKTPVT